jgi:UDP-N-acetylmuramate dehydrogenase
VHEALGVARARGLPLKVLGSGSNLVVRDAGVEAVVLAMRTRGRSARRAADGAVVVEAEAGEGWDDLVAWTVGEGWQGLECLSGIPGLVGATPIQNVGAYGQEVSETVTAVEAWDLRRGEQVTLSAADCAFGYRDSALKRSAERFVVLKVTFTLRAGAVPSLRYGELSRALADEAPTLARVREAVLGLRRSKSMVYDPLDPNRRSAGSFFMNPVVDAATAALVAQRALAQGLGAAPAWPQADGRVKLAAGWLIERAGLSRGLRRGAVGLSSAHALALVHHGQGTTSALLALADEVVATVRDAFGVTLEREPVLWG